MAAFYTITDLGETHPWALLRVDGALYERSVPGEGWLRDSFFATYFAGSDPGARAVSDAESGSVEVGPGHRGTGWRGGPVAGTVVTASLV
jgi:hypothetical protein